MSARSSRPIWLGEDCRTWDHARVHLQLLVDARLGAYEHSVYLGLAGHADSDTGATEPSEETLARYAGCSVRRVRTALDLLHGAGYVAIARRAGKASHYSLLPPPAVPPEYLQSEPPDVPTPAPGAGVQPSPAPGAGHPGTTFRAPRHQVPTNEKKNYIPPPTPPAGGGELRNNGHPAAPRRRRRPDPADAAVAASWAAAERNTAEHRAMAAELPEKPTTSPERVAGLRAGLRAPPAGSVSETR